jgi:hypothetical protein
MAAKLQSLDTSARKRVLIIKIYKILAFGYKNTLFQLPTMMSSQSLHMETVLTRFLAFM